MPTSKLWRAHSVPFYTLEGTLRAPFTLSRIHSVPLLHFGGHTPWPFYTFDGTLLAPLTLWRAQFVPLLRYGGLTLCPLYAVESAHRED